VVTVVTILAWSLLVVMVALVIGRPLWRRWQRHPLPPDRLGHEVLVKLYAIRRCLEVSQVKTEVRRDGARLRRQLREELDGRPRRRP
jgi:hypothetical protein